VGTRFFGLRAHAFAFPDGTLVLALSRSFKTLFCALLPSRSLFFALLIFRVGTFALVRLYINLYTAKKGHAEQDSQNRTARTGQPE
jgi:hypothetical protein